MDKQYIIDEIKRTAAANNGVPLGVRRFATETGVKVTDWQGRFWVRWSDGLREAGYEPNAMQTTYTDDELIGHLLRLIRELGHFPVKAELLMAARNDKGFPSDWAFRSHFGARGDLAKRLVEFCSTRPDLQDVAAICAPVGNRAEKPSEKSVGKEELVFGFVYLIRSGRNYKIGRSNAAGRRHYELAIQLPDKALKVHEIRTDDPVGIEAYWHSRFAAKRKNGEWFELAAADIATFKRRKFM